MKKSVGLILAQSKSKRLPGKNTLMFHGKPMFLTNVKKCLKIFDEVYVSSDSPDILELANKAGAKGIIRGEELCGDVPNIPVYQHAIARMHSKGVVAVQANSPTISPKIIQAAKDLLESGFEEVMTCHEDHSIYGSVWAVSSNKLKNYEDPYNPKPDALLVDTSVDVHTKEDFVTAVKFK